MLNPEPPVRVHDSRSCTISAAVTMQSCGGGCTRERRAEDAVVRVTVDRRKNSQESEAILQLLRRASLSLHRPAAAAASSGGFCVRDVEITGDHRRVSVSGPSARVGVARHCGHCGGCDVRRHFGLGPHAEVKELDGERGSACGDRVEHAVGMDELPPLQRVGDGRRGGTEEGESDMAAR